MQHCALELFSSIFLHVAYLDIWYIPTWSFLSERTSACVCTQNPHRPWPHLRRPRLITRKSISLCHRSWRIKDENRKNDDRCSHYFTLHYRVLSFSHHLWSSSFIFDAFISEYIFYEISLCTTRDLCWLIWVSRDLPLGKLMPWQISNRYSMPSVTQMYDTIPSMSVLSKVDVKQLSADRFLNVSGQYAETAADTLVSVYGRYNWLLKATMSGLVMTSFTWFILYKDSSIPGVNPPSPFSPSKQR